MSTIIILGFFVYYVVLVLMFEHKGSHYGPFPSKTRQVKHIHRHQEDEGGVESTSVYTQPVTLFDWVRRLFGLYEIVKDDPLDDGGATTSFLEGPDEFWLVREDRLDVWTCPICLSFWVATWSGLAYLIFVDSNPVMAFFSWFAAAGISAFLHQVLNAMLYPKLPILTIEGPEEDYDAG